MLIHIFPPFLNKTSLKYRKKRTSTDFVYEPLKKKSEVTTKVTKEKYPKGKVPLIGKYEYC